MKTITESPDSLIMRINDVTITNINGSRYANISYGITGQMGVLINQEDAVASLFASSDEELEHARDAMRRAMRMSNAAKRLSKK